MILLRDAPVSFLFGMFFLLGESCFVGGARASGRFALLADSQRAGDKIGKALLGALPVPRLTSCIACDYPDRAFLTQSGCEPLLQR